jgi:hypothetical protein
MDKCKKCGGIFIDTEYMPYGHSVSGYSSGKECLKKRCKHCGYEWTEETEDKK